MRDIAENIDPDVAIRLDTRPAFPTPDVMVIFVFSEFS
jgi:hypothetical protein